MGREEKSKEGGDRRVIYRVLFAVCVIGLAVCAIFGVRRYLARRSAQARYAGLAAQNTEGAASGGGEDGAIPTRGGGLSEELGIPVPDKLLDWDALAEENMDIYAWIYIPGTQVDYPIVQHGTDDSYYLGHNLDGSSGYPGCIYSERVSSKDFMDTVTVLYGHNMKDGSMFGSLHEYEDNGFFDENPYIYIYTPYGILAYEIFSACPYGSSHIMYTYDFTAAEGVQQYIDSLLGAREMNSHVRQGVEVPAGSRVLTLSTCVGGNDGKRWLVSGVLLNGPEGAAGG